MTANVLFLWQMELPLVLMADVIAIMADGIAMYRLECKADVIDFVVDGITTGSYSNSNLNKTLWLYHLPQRL